MVDKRKSSRTFFFWLFVLAMSGYFAVDKGFIVFGDDQIILSLNADNSRPASNYSPPRPMPAPINSKQGTGLNSLPREPSKTTPLFTPEPAYSDTLYRPDADWGSGDGSRRYYNQDTQSCIAEYRKTDGTRFLFGLSGSKGYFFLAFSSAQFSELSQENLGGVKLRFDGRREFSPKMEIAVIGGKKVFWGRYDSAVLKEEVARSGTMELVVGNRNLLQTSLVGTRANLNALAECQTVNLSTNPSADSPGSASYARLMCADAPANGQILKTRLRLIKVGHKLTVDNENSGDAIVIVRRAPDYQLVLSFFVKAGAKHSVSGLPDGTYKLQFGHGNELDQSCRSFASGVAEEFEQLQKFSTSKKRKGNQIITTTRQLTITLYKVAGGNTKTFPIDMTELSKE
ncbi:MAG: hypothetical protein R3D34_05740 [Nitratireductor sp.]